MGIAGSPTSHSDTQPHVGYTWESSDQQSSERTAASGDGSERRWRSTSLLRVCTALSRMKRTPMAFRFDTSSKTRRTPRRRLSIWTGAVCVCFNSDFPRNLLFQFFFASLCGLNHFFLSFQVKNWQECLPCVRSYTTKMTTSNKPPVTPISGFAKVICCTVFWMWKSFMRGTLTREFEMIHLTTARPRRAVRARNWKKLLALEAWRCVPSTRKQPCKSGEAVNTHLHVVQIGSHKELSRKYRSGTPGM